MQSCVAECKTRHDCPAARAHLQAMLLLYMQPWDTECGAQSKTRAQKCRCAPPMTRAGRTGVVGFKFKKHVGWGGHVFQGTSAVHICDAGRRFRGRAAPDDTGTESLVEYRAAKSPKRPSVRSWLSPVSREASRTLRAACTASPRALFDTDLRAHR